MSIISIRLNQKEAKILKFLTQYLDRDKSSLIKHSLNDLYDDILDREEIKTFERKEKKKKIQFLSFDQISKKLNK